MSKTPHVFIQVQDPQIAIVSVNLDAIKDARINNWLAVCGFNKFIHTRVVYNWKELVRMLNSVDVEIINNETPVKLITHDPTPFFYAVQTYRGIKFENTYTVANKLWKAGHYSPYEFLIYTFRLEKVSMVLLRHITRHRTFKFAASSNRHAKIDWNVINTTKGVIYETEGTVPYLKDKKVKYKIEVESDATLTNDELCYVTPACYSYNVTITADLRNLVNFWVQRLHPSAHFEIRSIATEMLRLVKMVTPYIDIDEWIQKVGR